MRPAARRVDQKALPVRRHVPIMIRGGGPPTSSSTSRGARLLDVGLARSSRKEAPDSSADDGDDSGRDDRGHRFRLGRLVRSSETGTFRHRGHERIPCSQPTSPQRNGLFGLLCELDGSGDMAERPCPVRGPRACGRAGRRRQSCCGSWRCAVSATAPASSSLDRRTSHRRSPLWALACQRNATIHARSRT